MQRARRFGAGWHGAGWQSVLLGLCVGAVLSTELASQSGGVRKLTVKLYLPFAFGQRCAIMQGQDQGPTHNDKYNRYAIDFDCPVGTPVHSATDGVVVFVKEDAVGPTGQDNDNNKLVVRHADGTCAEYLHLKKDGVLVEVGAKVFAGDPVALSGNTGRTGSPHLHFALLSSYPSGFSIPMGFEDVAGKGVPKTGGSEVSQNLRSREVVGGILWLEGAWAVCRGLECRGALAKILKPQIERKKLPKSIARLVARARKQGRKGIDVMFRARRDGLLRICESELRARLVAMDEAVAEKRHGDALKIAFASNLEFEWHPDSSRFRRTHASLLRDKSLKAELRPLLEDLPKIRSRRSKLGRAFESAWKARSLSGKRRKTAIRKLRKTFDSILKSTPEGKARAGLESWLAETVYSG